MISKKNYAKVAFIYLISTHICNLRAAQEMSFHFAQNGKRNLHD